MSRQKKYTSTVRSRWLRWPAKILKGLLAIVCAYLLILLVGLVPVNSDFQPTSGGVKLFLRSNSVHADIIMPLTNEVIDWREEFPASSFSDDVGAMTHLAVGWGDKGFFINTPTWGDLKLSTAANALLLPSATCLHVIMTQEQLLPDTCHSVEISNEQYRELVSYIKKSFRLEDGRRIPIPGSAYGNCDMFFEANGNYHLLNTCNSWVGGGLKAAGVKTPFLTPMPKSPFLYLPE